MPFATPSKCFICGKIHSCDTQDTLQLVNANYVTVNVCKSHIGVIEESNRQNNLSTEEKADLAFKTISTPEFKKMYQEYMASLIEKCPHHKDFLGSITLF
jgi:predicted NUDIX family phosphoesterase